MNNSMIVINCVQGGETWKLAKLGVASSSNFSKIITTKGETSKQREAYFNRLFDELMTGEPGKDFKNENMQRGNDREQEARNFFELHENRTITYDGIGFCYLDSAGEIGSSPDGLIEEEGGFESKDALPHVQRERIENGWSGTEHVLQVQGNLWVTGRKWWKLQSYCRGMPPVIIHFDRNESLIEDISREVKIFARQLRNAVAKYK